MDTQLQLPVRNAGLYAAMRRCVEDAFELLRADRLKGADISFSVEEHRKLQPDKPFYEFRPMTERFVRDRLSRIWEQPAAIEAAWTISSDPACSSFLRAGRADAVADLEQVARDEILAPLLVTMGELSPTFELAEDALLEHYLRLENVLYTETRRFVAITPLWGVRLIYGDLEIAPGVTIRQVDPELLRMEWPEAAQLDWGDGSREGLPDVVLQFERQIGADDGDDVLDTLTPIVQVIGVIRALAGGSICAGPVVMERFDWRALAPRPIPAIAARRCGSIPSRIDGTVAMHLPTALRRLSGDPDGTMARALERYQYAATSQGMAALRAIFDMLVEIYADEREVGSAALRLASVVGSSLAERRQLVLAMREAAIAIRAATIEPATLLAHTRLLASALRATVAAGLIGELPVTGLRAYADDVIIGERERRMLGVAVVDE